ncbi:zinc finger and SCAN domain-containing protein 21-like [Elgaria multicarinata webbii]|uniref:zinc finger and SCAN domain-containing protein 21-like n=1 Tax=Elgaria multicarinata webbii TaxID=159646 RepID=UPI002FCD1054
MATELRAAGAMSYSFQNVLECGVSSARKTREEAQAQPLEADGERMVPRVIQVGTIGEFLGWMAPQELTQRPEEGAAQCWETQWQEVLKAVQPLPSGWGSQLQSKPLPWDSSCETVTQSNPWPSREGVAQLLVDNNGDIPRAFGNPGIVENRAVKATVMGEGAVNTEARRQRFRQFSYQEAQGPREVWKRLREFCQWWLTPEKHTKEQILELLILEQFLAILPQEMQSWVKARCPQVCSQAVALAEEFLRGQQREVKVLRPCDDVVVVSSEAEWSPLDSGSSRHVGREAQLEDGQDPSSSGKTRCLDTYALSTGERTVNGNKSGTSQQVCSELPVLLGTLLGQSGSLDRGCQLVQENRTDLPDRWDEATLCSEGVYETVVRLEEHGHWCLECGESFQDASQLTRHQKTTHTGRKRPECPECGKSFRDISHVLRHQTVHTGEKPYACPECGQSFTQKPALNRHLRKHLDDTDFAGLEVTIRTPRIQTGPRKRPECLECGKSFRDVSQVLRHQTVHTGERPYSCLECGQSFTQKPALNRHKRKHLEDKPSGGDGEVHVNRENTSMELAVSQDRLWGASPENAAAARCASKDWPGRNQPGEPMLGVVGGLRARRNLSRRGQKKYWCFICVKGFRDKADLVRHERIHTGEKPYMCLDCGRRFNHTSSMYKHQLTHRRPVHPEAKESTGEHFICEQDYILNVDEAGEESSGGLSNGIQVKIEAQEEEPHTGPILLSVGNVTER